MEEFEDLATWLKKQLGPSAEMMLKPCCQQGSPFLSPPVEASECRRCKYLIASWSPRPHWCRVLLGSMVPLAVRVGVKCSS